MIKCDREFVPLSLPLLVAYLPQITQVKQVGDLFSGWVLNWVLVLVSRSIINMNQRCFSWKLKILCVIFFRG